MGRSPRHRTNCNARPIDGYSDKPLAPLPDTILPGMGDVLPFTRPAEPTASAINCKTAWRSPWLNATLLARIYCAQPRANSSRRCSALVASAVRTRSSYAHLRRPAMVALCRHPFMEVTGDSALLDEVVSFLDGDFTRPRTDRVLLPALGLGTRATLFEHCARALDRSLCRWQPWSSADGHRRLE